MWKLTDLAAAEIEALETEGFHVTPQEVLHIQQLSLDVVSPVEGVSLARGVPLRIGNVVLWPPTIASHCYYTEAMQMGLSPRLRIHALAYSMAFAHEPSVVGMPPDIKSIKRWARRLCCRFEELAEAVNLVLGDGAKPSEGGVEEDPRDKRFSMASIAQDAVALCGGSPEFWEYQVSLPYVSELIQRALRLRSALGGTPMKDSPTALRKLAIYIDHLKKAHTNGK